LRSFQKHLADFNARGIRVAGISTDAADITRQHCQKRGFTFAFLTDPKAEVVRRYGLLHQGGGPQGTDIARPAEFLIDPTGVIRWVNLTESVTVRARPEQVRRAVDELMPAAP